MHRSGTSSIPVDTSNIDALMSPAAYEHAVATVESIETHISWLLLAGDYAYKIKKPITLDFLDFSQLEYRKFFCDEEIRLNQPFASEIYLDVVPITLRNGRPRVGGKSTPIEYAVRMRHFDQALRLDAQLERRDLSVADMQELAINIAARHRAAQLIVESRHDTVIARTKALIWDNITALQGFISGDSLELLRNWTKQELGKLEPVLWQRFDDGFVRDCHGDLHLANLVRLPSGVTTIDCIEFNADLRHIDVACEMAKRQIARRVPMLVIMCGLSGSGKTRVSTELMATVPAIRIRSDIERKRISGLAATQSSTSDVGEGLYTQQINRDIYAHLLRIARTILTSMFCSTKLKRLTRWRLTSRHRHLSRRTSVQWISPRLRAAYSP